MPHNRFYINAPLKKGDEIFLQDSELHHFRVSRIRLGQNIALINGRGQLAEAILLSIDNKQARLRIEEVIEEQSRAKAIILAQGLSRMEHLEWTVEKGTELGVYSFWLFPGILSEKNTLSENQIKRLNHLILSATKQCGRLDLPSLELKPPLLQWGPLEGTLFYGDPSSDAPFLWNLSFDPIPPLIFFIGPESGLDPREKQHLNDYLHARGVRLHINTLRTETASLAALSLLQKFI